MARQLKITRIGNSKGVRLPADTLRRYRIGTAVVLEERSDGILLRPLGPALPKLSWEETARAMAGSAEDWSTWDTTLGDGLANLPWAPETRRPRVAEPKKTDYLARRAHGRNR